MDQDEVVQCDMVGEIDAEVAVAGGDLVGLMDVEAVKGGVAAADKPEAESA